MLPACSSPAGDESVVRKPGDALVVCADRLLRTLLLRLLEKQGWQVSAAENLGKAGKSDVFHSLVVFDLALARGSAATFAGEIVRALPASRWAAIDSGLSDAERAAVLDAGVSLMLPRNPSLADLAPLSPEA